MCSPLQYFLLHLLQPQVLQHRCSRFGPTAASNWTGTKGDTCDVMAMTRTAAFRAAQPVGALATSSDRIDVYGWPRRGHRESSSAELITVRFKSSFAAGSLLVLFFSPLSVCLSFRLSHVASLKESPLFWSVSLSVSNQRAQITDLIGFKEGFQGKWQTIIGCYTAS